MTARRLAMSLPPPPTVEKLQTALHTKAKGSPDYRFYALYDKVYRRDVLEWAYARCRDNAGAPGVDGQTFEGIEAYGLGRWLDELAEDLKQRTYFPRPVRRVYIPKPDGKQRPLGIPCIVDRVAQMATVLVLEPIFEADLEPEQYGYRPGRSALDAVRQVERLVRSGHTEVIDGDLSGYFDAIPHAELMKLLSRRISDRFILKRIKMWLEAAVEETDERGHRHRTTRNKDEGRGSPQGSPISPLLSNIYMRRFVKGWKTGGHERRLKARIVNYADDCAPGNVCSRWGRSLGAGLRRQAPNHLERLGSRAPVVSVKEKARRDCVRCGSGRRTGVNHRRSVESVWTTSKPGLSRCSGISAGGDPLTASVASGIKVARARSWLEQGTWEPVASMLREEPKWKTHEGQSTDAGHRGGWACSSVEVPVMGMERRGPITRFRRRV